MSVRLAHPSADTTRGLTGDSGSVRLPGPVAVLVGRVNRGDGAAQLNCDGVHKSTADESQKDKSLSPIAWAAYGAAL